MSWIIGLAAIVVPIFVALVGLEYRNLKRRIAALETGQDDDDQRHVSLRGKVDTMWQYLFGREDDSTDGGIAEEIEDGFGEIGDRLDEVEKRQNTYHEEEMSQLRRLVNELHDEDNVDIEREDVFKRD